MADEEDCMCPSYILAINDDFHVRVTNETVAQYSDLSDALKMCVGLYHVLGIHYGHANSHCWCLSIVAKTYRLGGTEGTDLKMESAKWKSAIKRVCAL